MAEPTSASDAPHRNGFARLRFVPHPLLAGFHRQTLAAALFTGGRPRAVRPRVFRIDGHNAVLGLVQPAPREDAPVLLLLHGLTGDARSSYMRRMARKGAALGFRVVRLNCRNCGGTESLCATLYHGGLSEDVLAVARQLAQDGASRIFVAGFSLGGNLALRLAGACGAAPPPWLAGVASVSGALDLASCADRIDGTPALAPYRRQFVSGLAGLLRRRARLQPGRRDLTGLSRVHTLRELDERWTGPEFGFRGAAEYYERASALPLLPCLSVPALLVASRDDAFVPADVHERAATLAPPGVQVLLGDQGGHCAFFGARPVEEDGVRDPDRFWAENRVLRFAARTCGL